jgi:hypothetical protein
VRWSKAFNREFLTDRGYKNVTLETIMNTKRLSAMSGLASNPANRQIDSSSGASGAPQKKILDFFFFFFSKKVYEALSGTSG